jgi:hypothetical protein
MSALPPIAGISGAVLSAPKSAVADRIPSGARSVQGIRDAALEDRPEYFGQNIRSTKITNWPKNRTSKFSIQSPTSPTDSALTEKISKGSRQRPRLQSRSLLDYSLRERAARPCRRRQNKKGMPPCVRLQLPRPSAPCPACSPKGETGGGAPAGQKAGRGRGTFSLSVCF